MPLTRHERKLADAPDAVLPYLVFEGAVDTVVQTLNRVIREDRIDVDVYRLGNLVFMDRTGAPAELAKARNKEQCLEEQRDVIRFAAGFLHGLELPLIGIVDLNLAQRPPAAAIRVAIERANSTEAPQRVGRGPMPRAAQSTNAPA